jgi:hypothetical protein
VRLPAGGSVSGPVGPADDASTHDQATDPAPRRFNVRANCAHNSSSLKSARERVATAGVLLPRVPAGVHRLPDSLSVWQKRSPADRNPRTRWPIATGQWNARKPDRP